MKAALATTAILASVASAAGRKFTVVNNCPFTIWPAIFTDPSTGSAVPNHSTGWEQRAFSPESFDVPDDWRAGSIWARRNCDFSNGAGSCLTGGCEGGLECTGTGAAPVTVAQFTLGANGADLTSVSLIDGFNLPVKVSNNKGCRTHDCIVDLNPTCPSPLDGPVDERGRPVGCNSACSAGLGDPANSPNCCTGTHSTPATCPASGVEFYSFFKSGCPTASVFPYDDSDALLACPSSLAADYTVTFCP